MSRQSVLLVVIFFLSTHPGHAHDLWLIPPDTADGKQTVTLV